jgi:hypothetical protein
MTACGSFGHPGKSRWSGRDFGEDLLDADQLLMSLQVIGINREASLA